MTAITALAPAVRASSQEVAFAVANVVLFGLLGMLVYPYFAHETLPTAAQAGLFMGTAVHDTSQVLLWELALSPQLSRFVCLMGADELRSGNDLSCPAANRDKDTCEATRH